MSTTIQWRDMTHTAQQIDAAVDAANSHIADSSVHMTAAEKTKLAGLENYDDTEVRGLIAAKQDALTFDQTPTENSQNPVYSGGVFPLQNALATIIDETCKKNVLENVAETTTVGDEVTFTINADGTVTAECIATTTSSRQLSWYTTVPKGTWFFSTEQAQSGGSTAPCHAYLYTTSTIARDYGEMQQFTLAEDTLLRCYISVRSGQAQGTTFTFKPMVTHPEWYAISSKYVPYTAET